MLIQMMEISKGLQEEIQIVQNKLKNAIQDHQILVGRLKDDPKDSDDLRRIQDVQRHIVSLGRCQKQIVQRLRTEVDANKAENSNEEKISLMKLVGLNNNNHIITTNEKTDEVKNCINQCQISTKENYEDIVRNCDIREIIDAKERSSSVETISADDVIELSSSEPTLPEENKSEIYFLANLGLITSSNFDELQNKRAERKTKNTANLQFVYSNWEIPMKKKKYSYLQSAGNAPQTRQTTAKLNVFSPSKLQKPPTKTIPKSSITAQKSNSRPNILRNESRELLNDRVELENGMPIAVVSIKTESKALHIPGLSSNLTIKNIKNDTAVCIHCRNPGRLTVCDLCSSNFHLSCHLISPPPQRLCPKCAIQKHEHDTKTIPIEKDEELVATSYAPEIAENARENPKIYKTDHGIHPGYSNATGGSVNQLSTFLIPIVRSGQPEKPVTDRQESTVTYTPLLINNFANQHQGCAYVKSESFTCQLPFDKQSYLIIKKLANSNSQTSGEARINSPLLYSKLRGKKSVRAVPGLKPITDEICLESTCNLYNKSQRVESIITRENSVVDRLARRLSEDRTSSCRSIQSTKYVKMEEAHLSAPLETTLVQDRPKSYPSIEETDWNTRQERGKPRILMRKDRRSLDSLQSTKIYKEDFGMNDLSGKNKEIDFCDETTVSASEAEENDLPNGKFLVAAIDMRVLEKFESVIKHSDPEDTADSK